MDKSHYDQQEDKDPFDAVLEAKGSVGSADRSLYEREEKVQGYLRTVKRAGLFPNRLAYLRYFTGQNPAPDAAYCRVRLGGKISPLLRWHYYLALYFAERGDWLTMAIPLILDSAERAGGAGDGGLRSSSYLLLAHNLNRWHNCGKDGMVLELALRLARRCWSDHYAHWIVSVVADLERRPDIRDEMRDLMLEAAGKATPDMAHHYLEEAIDVAGDKAPARAAWVDIHERRGGEAQCPLLKMSYYYDAKEHLDDKEGLRRINAKIKEAQKRVKLDKFTYECKAPKIDICGATGLDRVGCLVGILRSSIPSVEAARIREDEMRERFPLQDLLPRISIRSDGLPGPGPRAAGPDGATADHVGRFARAIQSLQIILSAAAREHEADGRIRAGDYEGYLETFGLLTDAAKKLAGAGIKAHCSGDYTASVHILIPQVEQALRLLLEQRGVPTLGGGGRVRQDLLKRMIAEGEGVLGRDLAEFLRVWLIDEGAVNLRNRVCHALYADYPNMDGHDPLHGLDHGTSLLLILVVCLLVGMSVDSAGVRARDWGGDRATIEGKTANSKGLPGNAV